jgi:hypothetical protein
VFEGRLVKVSLKGGEVRALEPAPRLSNIKIQLLDTQGELIPGDLYGKVMEHLSESRPGFSVRFTSVPFEEALLNLLLHGQLTPQG